MLKTISVMEWTDDLKRRTIYDGGGAYGVWDSGSTTMLDGTIQFLDNRSHHFD
jgi:hypothetical protein